MSKAMRNFRCCNTLWRTASNCTDHEPKMGGTDVLRQLIWQEQQLVAVE